MNRIQPESVVNAYKSTKLLPNQGEFFTFNDCWDEDDELLDSERVVAACALGVLFYDKRRYEATESKIKVEFDLTDHYFDGFTTGFDDSVQVLGVSADENMRIEEFRLGVQDGSRARQAVAAAVNAKEIGPWFTRYSGDK